MLHIIVDAVRGKKYTVVHNYGHSSHGKQIIWHAPRNGLIYYCLQLGYQSSWGSAERVVKLVKMDTLMAKL